MNIIANAGPVRRVVIFSEQLHAAPQPRRGPQGVGDEVGFGIVLLADLPVRAGAGRIEVAQCRVAQAFATRDITQHLLHSELGAPVDADWGLGLGFGQRQALRLAIGRAGG